MLQKTILNSWYSVLLLTSGSSGPGKLQDHGLQFAAGRPCAGQEAAEQREPLRQQEGTESPLLHRPGVHPGEPEGPRAGRRRRHVSKPFIIKKPSYSPTKLLIMSV